MFAAAEREEAEFERLKANKKQLTAEQLQLAYQPPTPVGESVRVMKT